MSERIGIECVMGKLLQAANHDVEKAQTVNVYLNTYK
jgi:ATP-dependent protease Clp ATPase subunit